MGFGRKDKEQGVKKSTQARSFKSPYGELRQGRKSSSYAPTLDASQRATMPLRNDKILQTMQGLPTQFNVEDFYNNPFYGSTAALLRRPIMEQYNLDRQDLLNNLNARNQVGSSYDALSNMYLMRQRDNMLTDAELQARQASADAYGNSINTGLALLAGLRNDAGADLEQQFLPMRYALGNQQALNPLQAAQANYYANEKTTMDNIMDYQKANMQAVAGAAAAACWVAREVYGADNPRWTEFRHWLLNEAPDDIRETYLAYGPAVAEAIRGDDEAKALFRADMDAILEVAA